MAAFRLAWAHGADGAELDVHLSRDEKIIVCHDANTMRTTGKNRLIEVTDSSELRDLPQLGEVVAEIPAGRELLVEVKCGIEILYWLAAAKLPVEKVGFLSFDREVLQGIKEKYPKHRCMLNVEPEKFSAEKLISLAGAQTARAASGENGGADRRSARTDQAQTRPSAPQFDGVSLGWHPSIERTLVDALHAAKLTVAVWTVDDPEIAKRAGEAGVDILMTNRPREIREALRAG